jgi:hypothetical protein
MRFFDQIELAFKGVFASLFSLFSNVLSVFVGLLFFGLLISLSWGVGLFLEKYYTRTMSLTSLLVFQSPNGAREKPFDVKYRASLKKMSGVENLYYHDTDFVEIQLNPRTKLDATLRPAVPDDPEIKRLELVVGSNLPESDDPLRPPVVLSLVQAEQLSEVPPNDLIGLEIAMTFLRGREGEKEFRRESIYGTIVGIANETPDQSVYVPYQVLCMARAWENELKAVRSDAASSAGDKTVDPDPGVPVKDNEETSNRSTIASPMATDPGNTPEVAETSQPDASGAGESTKETRGADEATELGSSDAPDSPADTAAHSKKETNMIAVPAAGKPSDSDARAPHSAGEAKQPAAELDFKYAALRQAWDAIKGDVGRDAIVYPNLRVHATTAGALIDLRNYFRSERLATTSVLDDAAAIRELRNYALTVGSVIGLITLVAAGCSIFNTLLASVERRTREIGILRSLGASSPNILAIFLLEGAINAVIGGLIAVAGIYLAVSAVNPWIIDKLKGSEDFAKLAEMQPDLFAFPWWLPWIVLALGIVVSFFASLVPAIRACLIQPTTALRHE